MIDNYCKILNTYISAVNMPETVTYLTECLEELRGQYVCVANVHTTAMAYRDRSYRRIQNESALTIPDGNPLAEACWRCGYTDATRVAGPDLMTELFKLSAEKGYRHFFYGGSQETLDTLKEKLLERYPGIHIAGMYSPPFRPLTEVEEAEDVERINAAAPDYIWVGLGAPKQERWMYRNRGRVTGLMIGVGAGFEFHAGIRKRAPEWMQKKSLEWMFRLTQDPRRLWKRYLSTNLLYMEKQIFGKAYCTRDSRRSVTDKQEKKIENCQHVFIIGSKGIPAQYGGFETFVEKLTEHKKNPNIHYHVSCLDTKTTEEIYNDARCYHIKVPKSLGAAKAVYYDYRAVKMALRYIRANQIENPIIYILACRIGPAMNSLSRKIHEAGGAVYVNPDGHEWQRSKWNWFIKKYWKLSERLMVKHADLLICDAKLMEQYIQETYRRYHPKTTFLAYGAELPRKLSQEEQKQVEEWFKEQHVVPNEYYLMVGRFVPENNYYTILKEFMSSDTKKDLVIVTNIIEGHLYKRLEKELHFERDKRIKFVGTVYEPALLQSIRMNAFAYIHGHEVGGTNPSLLEALSMTKLNLLYDVGFNREVAGDAAVYWNKQQDSLKKVVEEVEQLDMREKGKIGEAAQGPVLKVYNWKTICGKYEILFLE